MSRDVAVYGAHEHLIGLSPRPSSEVLGCFHTMRKVLLELFILQPLCLVPLD